MLCRSASSSVAWFRDIEVICPKDFNHRCLHSIARIGWTDRENNAQVRHRDFGAGSEDVLSQLIHFRRLRWLGYVLCEELLSTIHCPICRLSHRVQDAIWRSTDDVRLRNEKTYVELEYTRCLTSPRLRSKPSDNEVVVDAEEYDNETRIVTSNQNS